MAATSMTGTGKGAAFGADGKPAKQKPDNHCGCGCPGPDPEPSQPRPKRGCVVQYSSGNKVVYRTGTRTKTVVCG